MSSPSVGPQAENELAQVLERLQRQGRSPSSWGALTSSWRTFVASVERGYGDSIYDYTNDLTVRDRMALVLDEVSDEVRAVVEPELVTIDARFVEATGPSQVPIPGGDGRGWWWWRVPTRLGDELRADLEAERVIGAREP